MKPRRLLSSVDLLPTIVEIQESDSQSLEDYTDSIRELSQPTYPLSGPMQGLRLSSLRTAKHPAMSMATASAVLAYKPWAVLGPENISVTLTGSKAPVCLAQEPLDWLLAQAQHDGVSETTPEDLCLI